MHQLSFFLTSSRNLLTCRSRALGFESQIGRQQIPVQPSGRRHRTESMPDWMECSEWNQTVQRAWYCHTGSKTRNAKTMTTEPDVAAVCAQKTAPEEFPPPLEELWLERAGRLPRVTLLGRVEYSCATSKFLIPLRSVVIELASEGSLLDKRVNTKSTPTPQRRIWTYEAVRHFLLHRKSPSDRQGCISDWLERGPDRFGSAPGWVGNHLPGRPVC